MIFFPNARVSVLRPRVIEDMGSTFTDWNNPERLEFEELCHIQEGATREAYERADSVETDFTLWAPLELMLKAEDRIEFTYAVEGLSELPAQELQVIGRPKIMVDPVDPAESFQRAELKLIEG